MFGLGPGLGEDTDLTPARCAKVSRGDVYFCKIIIKCKNLPTPLSSALLTSLERLLTPKEEQSI